MKVTGIILIAGNSTRFASTINKNLVKVNDKCIFEYSLEKLLENELINDIIIAIKENEINFVQNIINKYRNKSIKLVHGGKTRKESVYNCLIQTDADIVIIQDGARPLIKQTYINKCIKSMNKFNGVSIAVKSKDTIKIADNYSVVIETTKRENTWIIQTPQCFKRKILLEAYKNFESNKSITDDCQLLELINEKVKLLQGDYTNIKITNPEDINLMIEFLKIYSFN